MNLDEVLPDPHYRMGHSRIVGAPRTVVWDELCRVTMSALPLGCGLEACACCRPASPGGSVNPWPNAPFST
jgi:hypothetical protein